MNHGYDDDDDDDYQPQAPAHHPPGPGGLLAQLMGGMGGGGYGGYGGFGFPAQPSAYDEYFKAFSVATMDGNERPELLYGGKIIMPPSALARLSGLDIPGPWTFQLRNPRNPKELMTHCGVLEFIASEGVVHLPAWMMKKLDLNEGDPVRLNGTTLPKGKLVKIQAQNTNFLEVSDPKAVLESALRFYSCLTRNDIIEITYNSLVFEFLIIDTKPDHASTGISVLDTDLEVDFETPKGYVEPARPAPAPVPTMASKLKIDLGETTSASADSSRPASSLGGGAADSGSLKSFTGIGQSLSGRRVRGKGLATKVKEVDAGSKINRADGPRIINSSSLGDGDRKVPVALKLPPGKFFFGYKYVPFDPAKAPAKPLDPAEAAAAAALAQEQAFFGGEGNTLSGKRKAPPSGSSSASVAGASTGDVKGKGKAVEEKEDPWAKLGGGNTLRAQASRAGGAVGGSAAAAVAASAPARAGPAPAPVPPPPPQHEVIDATMLDEDDFWAGEEVDYDDDDDVIEIDSD